AIAAALFAIAGFSAAALVEVPRLSENINSSNSGGASKEVTVPNVIGQPLDVAERQLHDASLRSQRGGGGRFRVLVPADWDVCAASPKPDSTTRPGSAVDLLIDRPDVC